MNVRYVYAHACTYAVDVLTKACTYAHVAYALGKTSFEKVVVSNTWWSD